MRRVLVLTFALLLCSVSAALSWIPPSPAQNITFAARSRADLRARLRAHLDSLDLREPAAALDAGECLSLLGQSHARAAESDSALRAFARAWPLRNDHEDGLQLAGLLFERNVPGDADSVRRMLTPMRGEFEEGRTAIAHATMIHLAWALAQTGAGREGRALAALHTPYLVTHAPWARRFARLALEAGEDSAAFATLLPALIRSRGLDLESMALARRISNGRMAPGSLLGTIERAAAREDSLEALVFTALGGRRQTLRASGADLRVWGFAAPRAGAPLAVVLCDAAQGSLTEADSLVAQLRRAGLAVALVDPPGVRGSVSAEHPWPESWSGREDAYLRACADAVPALVPALATALHADAHRVAVVVSGDLALAGARAARASAGRAAVLLIAPVIAPTDRAECIEAFTRSGASVFVQEAAEDVFGNEALERLASLLPPKKVRTADSRGRGRGVALYRTDPSIAPRFARWLQDQWSVSVPAAAPQRGAVKRAR